MLGWAIYAIAGCIPVFLISLLVSKMAFEEAEPDQKAFGSTLFAWIISGALASWGMGRNGNLELMAFLYYLPSAVIVFLFRRHRLRQTWVDDEDTFS